MRSKLLVCGLLLFGPSEFVVSQERNRSYPPVMNATRSEVYKSVVDVELKVYIFEPETHKPSQNRPAIVFFFGGGFTQGSPGQFDKHCEYFASRGIVATENSEPTRPGIFDGVSLMRCRQSKRPFAALVIVLALGPSAFADNPNVLLLLSDNMPWHLHGFLGNDLVRTPNLDRLASQGLVFTRGYVTMSLCRPSLASLVTGLYPHQHGITGNDPSPALLEQAGGDRNFLLTRIRNADTLPRLLKKAGYVSFQAGKWWEGSYADGGFTDGMTLNDPNVKGDPQVRNSGTARHGDQGLKIGKLGLQPIFDFIDRAGGKPFFVWYAPQLPHESRHAPDRLLEKYAGRFSTPFVDAFFAKCEWFDETVGELLGYLETKGLDDNTLVIYLSDNGGLPSHQTHSFAPRSLGSPYDTCLRTPIVIRWPGRVEPARDSQNPVSSIDVTRTILDAYGVESAATLPGVNLLDTQVAGKSPRSQLFGAVFWVKRPQVLDNDWDDLSETARALVVNRNAPAHSWFAESGEWTDAVQAYLACVSVSSRGTWNSIERTRKIDLVGLTTPSFPVGNVPDRCLPAPPSPEYPLLPVLRGLLGRIQAVLPLFL